MHVVEHRHRVRDTIITIAVTPLVLPVTNILPQTNGSVEIEIVLDLCEMLLL